MDVFQPHPPGWSLQLRLKCTVFWINPCSGPQSYLSLSEISCDTEQRQFWGLLPPSDVELDLKRKCDFEGVGEKREEGKEEGRAAAKRRRTDSNGAPQWTKVTQTQHH